MRLLYRPILKSLTHTFITLTLLLGVIIDATIGKAALDGSEGISMSSGLSEGKPFKVIFQEELGNFVVVIIDPKYFNILSV